jgi:hypothetical protein
MAFQFRRYQTFIIIFNFNNYKRMSIEQQNITDGSNLPDNMVSPDQNTIQVGSQPN